MITEEDFKTLERWQTRVDHGVMALKELHDEVFVTYRQVDTYITVELLKILLPKHDQIMRVIVRYSPEGREPVTKGTFWVHMDTTTALLHAWRMLGSMYWDIETGWIYDDV